MVNKFITFSFGFRNQFRQLATRPNRVWFLNPNLVYNLERKDKKWMIIFHQE